MRSTSATVVDAVVWPDETAGFLAQCPPGADAVVAQSVMEPERLSDAGQIDALVAIERQQSWLAARQQQLLAAMATDDPSRDRWVADEIACALRLAPITAQARLSACGSSYVTKHWTSTVWAWMCCGVGSSARLSSGPLDKLDGPASCRRGRRVLAGPRSVTTSGAGGGNRMATI